MKRIAICGSMTAWRKMVDVAYMLRERGYEVLLPEGTEEFASGARSEEAPGAEAAQPSWNVGNGKAQAGCFGGDARGAEKGAQPHNRPRLALAGGGPNNK